MIEIASTLVGGLIGMASSAIVIVLTDLLGRRNQNAAVVRDAIVEWVSAYEDWVALYNDFSGLVLGIPDSPDDLWKAKYLERLREADAAGRRLDIAKYRILVVESRVWVREAVTRITKASEVRAQTRSPNPKEWARDFRAAAP